jgi:hypothetical protein
MVVVELFDPFGGPIESLADADMEHGVVAIVLNIAFGGNGEGVLVGFDLFIKAGDGIIEGGNGSLVCLFPRLDGGSEGADDINEEGGTSMV